MIWVACYDLLVTALASEKVGGSFIGTSELNGGELDFLSLAHWASLNGGGLVLSVAELDGLDCGALRSKNGRERRSLCLGCESLGNSILCRSQSLDVMKRTKLFGRMVHTFVLCTAAIAGQDGVDISSRSLQEVTALGAEDEGSDSRHFK